MPAPSFVKVYGVTSTGELIPLLVDATGAVITSSGAAAAGATAENQVTEISKLDAIAADTDNLQYIHDIELNTDQLDIDLSALRDAIVGAVGSAKTLADIVTKLNGGLPAALGQTTMAASLPVVVASNQKVNPWTFLGEQAITADGAQSATIPEGTTIILIAAGVADLHYLINGTATANSMLIPVGLAHEIGPLTTLTSLSVFNAGGSKAYLNYYKEN